ncbi:hypothetical protein EMA8858_01522 [Emticicia aquatica]|uniref:Tetratricopeptide repeat protein n=1 Tax=Emticicia aquatica TaxID=1681835 RepID=A0ABM9ANQ7_9BACT|nr:tetratricopeptide repeat protein [Emticicia aquatica]CAH0995401.1 hypothetical protein EMA8858_01522 [Emticicia aquatica]
MKLPFFRFNKFIIIIASILFIWAGYWFLIRKDLPKMTDVYIEQNLTKLPINENPGDSLAIGKRFYNEKKYAEAAVVFEKLVGKKLQAIELAGLTALQMKEYDIAMIYFEKLEQNADLVENKGKFYTALVNLKMGKIQRAKKILKEVITQGLGGKREAEEWMK